MRRALGVLLLAAALGGGGPACGPSFPDPARVQNLRILAMRASPPALRPGERSSLTALVVDGDGPVDSATWRWSACAPRVGGGGRAEGGREEPEDRLDCDDAADRVELGSGPSVEVTIPGDYLKTPESLVLAELGGLFYMVELSVAGGERRAVKRLVVIPPRAEPNRNPRLEGVRPAAAADDEPASLEVDASTRQLLVRPIWDPEEPEDYVELAFDLGEGRCEGTEVPGLGCARVVERTELYYFNWYYAAGASLHEITDADYPEFRYQLPPPAALAALRDDEGVARVPLWVVLRDGRGGTDWLATEIFIHE